MDQHSDLLGMSETARALQVSVEYVRRLVDQGVLQAVRTPYGRLVKRESVAAEAERRRRNRANP